MELSAYREHVPYQLIYRADSADSQKQDAKRKTSKDLMTDPKDKHKEKSHWSLSP